MSSVDQLAEAWQTPRVLLTGRGCAGLGLYLAVRGWRGCSVVVPANICPVVAYTVTLSGNQPWFAEIGPDGLLDLEWTEAHAPENTVALVAAHMYGVPLEMGTVAALARRRGWSVIEDVAAALGGTGTAGPVGRHGDAVIASFGIGKHIDLGRGGALGVRDAVLAGRCATLAVKLPTLDLPAWARAERGYRDVVAVQPRPSQWSVGQRAAVIAALGFQFRDQDLLAAALGRAWEQYPARMAHLRAVSAVFDRRLNHPGLRAMRPPAGAVPWRYNLHLDPARRDALVSYLRAQGIKASTYFGACHRLFDGQVDRDYPETLRQERSIVNLWVKEETSVREAEWISDVITAWLNGQ